MSLNTQQKNALCTFVRAYGLGWTITTAPSILSVIIKALLVAKSKGAIQKAMTLVLKNSITQNGLPLLLATSFSCHQLFAKYKKATVFWSSWISIWLIRRLFPRIKTLDLTFFVFVRALDVFAHRMHASTRIRKAVPEWTLEYGNIAIFMLASTEIIFSWFYEPERLPKSYAGWITNMSGIDDRLLKALRAIRQGNWVYGKDTGLEGLLGDYCAQLGLPRSLGDPRTGRIACTIVHEGKAYGCEANALLRFYRGFIKIFPVYFSVHLFPSLFFRTAQFISNPTQSMFHILMASVRSSTFLGTYIAIIWYSICLVRTRIGYQLLGINQTRLDNTLAPLIGSMLCGLSLLVESKHRRSEMTLYVVPRALYSFTERILSPHQKGRWWEQTSAIFAENVVFAASMMIVVDAVYQNRQMVRPSVRGLLSWILHIQSQSGQSTPVEIEEEEEEGLTMKKKAIN